MLKRVLLPPDIILKTDFRHSLVILSMVHFVDITKLGTSYTSVGQFVHLNVLTFLFIPLPLFFLPIPLSLEMKVLVEKTLDLITE